MAPPPILAFIPVPLRRRHDGWSPELQDRFILLLARGCPVAEAARAVGKSRATAYALRSQPGAASFVAAWDAALAHAKRTRSAVAAARTPPPPPVRRQPGARGLVAGSPERRAFDRLLAALFPCGADDAGKTGEADKAGGR